MDVFKGLSKAVLELGRDDVFKVDVKDSFSFFNTDKSIEDKVLAFFTDFKHNGRFVNVEVSEDKGRRGKRSGGRRRRDGKPRSERRSDGRRSESVRKILKPVEKNAEDLKEKQSRQDDLENHQFPIGQDVLDVNKTPPVRDKKWA